MAVALRQRPPPPTTNKSCPGGVAGKWPAEWHFWRRKGERRGEKKETVGELKFFPTE